MDHRENLDVKRSRLSGPHAAPWYAVHQCQIISVEHPFIIHNVPKAIATLGGSEKVRELVGHDDSNIQATLYLRPEDRISKPIYSKNVATQNILLKITLPKRTGLKRKRGTHDPFQDTEEQPIIRTRESRSAIDSEVSSRSKDARDLLQKLRDNNGRYEIQLVGPIEQTHRFRTMPDFVCSTTNNTFVNKIREHILPFNYEKMKGFKFDLSKGPRVNTEIIPPPSLTHFSLPFNYSYKQNPATKQTVDGSGKLITINTQSARKVFTHLVTFDVKTVPSEPPSNAPPIDTLDGSMKSLVELVQRHLDERPIWTRRALSNQIRHPEWNALNKHVYQYVGYMFRSGPWRESLVKFGVDPRSHSCYRVYQTLMFQFDATGSSYQRPKRPNMLRRPRGGVRQSRKVRDEKSHVFDGVNLGMDGKVWQVCDITDPMLQLLLATTNLRNQCEISRDGWYHNGTWAKAKIIMKAKMSHITAGKGDPQASDYVQLAAMPDILDSNTKHKAIFTKNHATAQEIELASLVRAAAGPPEASQNNTYREPNVTGQLAQVVDRNSIENVGAEEEISTYGSVDHEGNETSQGRQANSLIGVLEDNDDTEGNESGSSGDDELEDIEYDDGDEEE